MRERERERKRQRGGNGKLNNAWTILDRYIERQIDRKIENW